MRTIRPYGKQILGSYGKAATPAIPLPELPRPSRADRWIGNLEEKEEALSVHRRFRWQWPRGHVSRQNGFCTFRAKMPIHAARMRHDGPGLRFTRYTRSQRIPITHAPRVDRFYTRPTAVLAAQAPLVTTFATHFLLPKSGLRCKKSGHGCGRAPVTPGLPFRYLHYLHGQLSTS